MAKRWLGLVTIFALLLTVALSGCSSNSGNTANPSNDVTDNNAAASTDTPKEDITLTILNAADGGIRDKFLLETVKPAFEQANPGVKLEVITVPYEQFDSKMSTLVAGGTPPDVWSHWGQSGFIDYQKRGLVADLSKYVTDFDNPNISDNLMSVYNLEGKQYGIPFSVFTSFVFYNKALTKKAGLDIPQYKFGDPEWTWDKLVEYGKQVSQNYGKPDATYGFTMSMGTHMATYSWDWGVDIFKDAYQTGYVEDASVLLDPKFAEAVKFFQGLVFENKISPTQAITDAIGKIGDPVMTGKVAMDLNGTWQLSGFKDQKMDFGILPIPTGPAGTATPFIYVDPLMISSKSQHPDEAWKLVKLLTSPEMQKTMVVQTAYPPADSEAYKEWYKQFDSLDPAYLQSLMEGSIEHGRESANHLIAGYAEITTFMENEQQPIFTKGEDVDKVLKEMEPKFQKLLDQIKQKTGQ